MYKILSLTLEYHSLVKDGINVQQKKELEMERQILLPAGQKKALVRAMNSTYPTVRSALRFRSNSENAKRIRYAAVRHFGGVQVDYGVRGGRIEDFAPQTTGTGE